MKKHAQWLQYLTALSLTLSGTAFAAPPAPVLDGPATVSSTAASKVNSMAETHVASTGDENLVQDWLRVIWAEWVQVIIVAQAEATGNTQPSEDFGSYRTLLDNVKSES